MRAHVSSEASGHKVTRRGCDRRHRIPRTDRQTQGRIREDLSGEELLKLKSEGRRKQESAVQRKESKGVPCNYNCTHTGMEMGPQIDRGEEKEVGLKRGFQTNLRTF